MQNIRLSCVNKKVKSCVVCRVKLFIFFYFSLPNFALMEKSQETFGGFFFFRFLLARHFSIAGAFFFVYDEAVCN